MKNLVTTLCDFYKISHRKQYPRGTQYVYSTWTPRGSRMDGVDRVVWFGLQAFLREYNDIFNRDFFNRDVEDELRDYSRMIKHTLGVQTPEVDHVRDLHELGYLPVLIKALPEGSVVPLRVPTLSIQNTHPKFFWVTNFVESLMSAELWHPSTSATIAHEFRKMMDGFAMKTTGSTDFVKFQGHDFSFRGMSGLHSAMMSGMGHLLSFVGTDTIPAISAAEEYYDADVTKELVGTSIPATEHSIQCAYGDDDEYVRRMFSEVHPSGFVSIVSDGYDFWDVVGRILPAHREAIMARDGRVVIRPDSGDPVLIVCGDPRASTALERKGAIEVLYDTFGGKVNKLGYKELDPHIGLIYGDAITLERGRQILAGLEMKGFASTNVVFGIGSYTYQYVTRDTFGWALKSSLVVIDGQEKKIFKNPKTDNGVKKSLAGRVAVYLDGNGYRAVEGYGLGSSPGDQLQVVYRDGVMYSEQTFAEVRARLAAARS